MKKDDQKNQKTPPENPIDPDKITETPHILPYAHTVGGVQIKPIDKGRVKGRAVTSMYEQTDMQLNQIRKQIELLAQQAKDIHKRVIISERIYEADMNFEPLVGFTYHLYQKADGAFVVSMVAPNEWGSRSPYTFIATVRMLADHTWDVLEEGEIDDLL
jgi:hypothetical protein